MIKLEKPNSEEFYLNPFHIEKMEVANYTLITLTNQKKYIVKTPLAEIVSRIKVFWKSTFNLSEKVNYLDNDMRK